MSESLGDAIVSQAAAAQNPAPNTEAVDVGQAVPEAKADDSTKRLAFFAKKEKALLEERARIKSENEAYRRQLEQEYEPVKKKSELLKRLESKDYDALKELGYDYNEWTNRLVNDGTPSHEFVMEQKLQQLESKLEQRLKEKEQEFTTKAEELKTQQQTQAEKRMQIDIKEFLTTDSSTADPKYQWLGIQDEPEVIIFNVIDQHYKKTLDETGVGRVLKYEEAAETAERYFEQEAEKRFSKVPKLKSMYERLYGAPKTPEPAVVAPPQRPTRSLDTLSPTMAVPTESPRPKSKGYDREEILKEAIRMVEQSRGQQK